MDTLDLVDTTAEMEIATESSRDIFNTDTGEIDKISTSGYMWMRKLVSGAQFNPGKICTFVHYSGSASLDAATVSAALGELGHWGQVTIVWFSIGVAVWQLVTVGTQLLAAGDTSRHRDIES